MTVKIAVFAPTPRARVTTASPAIPGVLRSWRNAWRKSLRNVCIDTSIRAGSSLSGQFRRQPLLEVSPAFSTVLRKPAGRRGEVFDRNRKQLFENEQPAGGRQTGTRDPVPDGTQPGYRRCGTLPRTSPGSRSSSDAWDCRSSLDSRGSAAFPPLPRETIGATYSYRSASIG